MNKIYLQRTEGQKFSRAEIHLANKLRTLKSTYRTKDDFIKHMTTAVDGMSFIKSEALRLYKAMREVKFYDNGTWLTGLDKNGKLCFRRELTTSGSNFFEEYAHTLLDDANIIQPRGRKPGVSYPRKQITLIEEPVKESVKEESVSPLRDVSTEELINELLSRANILSVRVEYGQTI